MRFKVWGCRGSIPVCGPRYARYGGDTTCAEIESATGETIILDAGTGLRPLGNEVLKRNTKKVDFLLTHCHWDHLMGFPFFKPIYRKGFRIDFHGCTIAQESIRTILKEALKPPFFPVKLTDLPSELRYDQQCLPAFEVGSLCCGGILLSHPNKGYGFLLAEGDKRLAFFPDNDPWFPHPGARKYEEYVDFVKGADLLVHDAEYRPEEYESFAKSYGHSMFRNTVRLAKDAGVKKLLMWHHNQDHSDDEVDAMLAEARSAAGPGLEVDAARPGMVLEL